MANATPEQSKPTAVFQVLTVADLSVDAVSSNPEILRQVILAQLSNRRQSPAHTKKRGEVSGGGRKPWRQKGTGRARVGSSRTPLWRGGGVIFGPTNARNFKKNIPTQLKRQALASTLQLRAKAGDIKTMIIPNTILKIKDVKQQLPELYVLRQALLILPDAKLRQAFNNLPNLKVATVATVNPVDILSAHSIIVAQGALELLKKRVQPNG